MKLYVVLCCAYCRWIKKRKRKEKYVMKDMKNMWPLMDNIKLRFIAYKSFPMKKRSKVFPLNGWIKQKFPSYGTKITFFIHHEYLFFMLLQLKQFTSNTFHVTLFFLCYLYRTTRPNGLNISYLFFFAERVILR